MTLPIANWVRLHPLIAFFSLAFMLTWANWVPRALASRGLIQIEVPDFMFVVAGYGPALAALIVTGFISGWVGLQQLGRRLVLWRVGLQWYAVVLLLPAAQALAAYALHRIFGGESHSSTTIPSLAIGSPDAPVWQRAMLLMCMFTLGFDGLGEELGWRGFALPRLLARYSALIASVVLGAAWAVWHLPYALMPNSAMAGRPFHEHLPNMFAVSILFTWIFNNTRGSILLAILFHAAGNVTYNVLPELVPGVYQSGLWGWIIPWLMVAAVIVCGGLRNVATISRS